VTATFHKLQYTLTGTITGTGSGTVNVNPPNVNYTSSFTRTYDYGTSVTLTATPATGSYFAGWSGACSGTGTCAVTMNANKNVTATFNLSDAVPPTTGIKIIRTATGEDVTTAGTWLRADTYTIKFFAQDNESGLNTYNYLIYPCDQYLKNCSSPIDDVTGNYNGEIGIKVEKNHSMDAGKSPKKYYLEGEGRYLIVLTVKDKSPTGNPTTTSKGLNFDFTPPKTWIE